MKKETKSTLKYLLYALSTATIWIATMVAVYYQGTVKGYAECYKDYLKAKVEEKQINVVLNENAEYYQ